MLGWLKNKHLHDFVHLNSSQIIRLSWFFSSKESKTSKVRKTLRIAASSGEKTPPSEEDSLCFTCDIRFLICQHINCFSAKTWCFYFLSNAYRAFPNFWVGMTSIWQPLSLSLSIWLFNWESLFDSERPIWFNQSSKKQKNRSRSMAILRLNC